MIKVMIKKMEVQTFYSPAVTFVKRAIGFFFVAGEKKSWLWLGKARKNKVFLFCTQAVLSWEKGRAACQRLELILDKAAAGDALLLPDVALYAQVDGKGQGFRRHHDETKFAYARIPLKEGSKTERAGIWRFGEMS